MFKPTYLYIKTHNVTGLKYFGKTVSKDPSKYKGSGKRWSNHINYHGYDVSTEILGYFTNEEECKEAALNFSKNYNIVESKEWANLEIEDGLNGGFVDCAGEKNTQFGKMWITNGVKNTKVFKTEPIPIGFRKGRVMPSDWGDNIRSKLKGRNHKEMLGEEKAAILKKQKQKIMNERWSKKRRQDE